MGKKWNKQMANLNMTTAFNRYGAKPRNVQWAVSAISDSGELVVSCWKQYLSSKDGKLVYTDRLSRWAGNKQGNNLLRSHLEAAFKDETNVRLVIAKAGNPAAVDSGESATDSQNTFGVRQDLVGRVSAFDGDEFILEFVKDREN